MHCMADSTMMDEVLSTDVKCPLFGRAYPAVDEWTRVLVPSQCSVVIRSSRRPGSGGDYVVDSCSDGLFWIVGGVEMGVWRTTN